MGRKSLKEIRCREIVKAFYTVSKKEGLENTSIAKVANHLKINPSLVIHYYKTKEELIMALVDYNLERYQAIYRIEGEIDSKEKVLELIGNLFSRKWSRLFDDGVYYSCYALTYRNKLIKEKYKIFHDSLRELLKDALSEAEKNEIIFRKGKSIQEIVGRIFVVLEGAYYYLGMTNDEKEYDEKMELFKQDVIGLLGIRD